MFIMGQIDLLNTVTYGGGFGILYKVVGREVWDRMYLDNYREREIFDLAAKIKEIEHETADARQL